jgi:hypothetical protein
MSTFNEVLRSGDLTANRRFAKIGNACDARVVIFTNWWTFGENQTNRRLLLSKVSWVCILRRELLQGRRYRPT